MRTFGKIFIYTLAVILLAWLLPWSYRFATARPTNLPFTLYSSVTKSFAYIETSKESPTKYKDFNGNSYTISQFDSILPFFYYRQLLTKDNLPDTINGIHVTAASIRKSNFTFKLTTRDVNVNSPKLWMMMESVPSHVDLEEPTTAFRLSDKIEFINMKDNCVEIKRSEAFNKVMQEKGFTFPVKALNGNPTTKKEYDEGYIMIDANNAVFHVKMMKGRPYIRKAKMSGDIKFTSAVTTEFADKRNLAFLGDEENNFYILDKEYNIQQLPFAYNPRVNDIMIIGNMMDWTVRVSDDQGYSLFAIDSDTFSVIDRYGYTYSHSTISERVASYIFPFNLSFTSSDDKYIKPRFEHISYNALIFNIILSIIYILVSARNIKKKYPYSIAILLLGVFIFIPLLLIRK